MRTYSVELYWAGTKVTYKGRPYEVISDQAKSNEIGGLERKVTIIPMELIEGEWEIADGPEKVVEPHEFELRDE